MEANASRHKAMSYGYMEKELARLRAEIRELTERAHQTGLAKVRGDWNLGCLSHNLLKIWRHQRALT